MIQDAIQRLWLESYDDEVSSSLRYESVPLYTYLDRAAAKTPKRPAIVFNHCKTSYARLKQMAETVAANFRANGVRQGDRVALMLPNLPQTIITYWGLLKAGAVVVMTNPLYMEKELSHHLADSGTRFLVTLDRLYAKVAPLRPQLPELRKIFVTGIEDGLRFPFKQLYTLKTRRSGEKVDIPFDDATVLPWKSLLKAGAPPVHPHINPHRDLAVLQYTGGTTGISKGVMLSHANMAANVQQCLAMLHRIGEKQETVLGLLPYFHIYGLTVCVNFATSIGATLVPFPRFAPIDVLKTIHKVRPTIFPSAPAVFQALLQHKDIQKYDLSSIQYCISGSAPIPRETINTFKELTGAEIIEGFGLTEASPITHLNPLRKKRKIGSIGLPFPDTDACIVDMEVGSLALPPGKVGELVIRGPQVMKGYWNRPDETATALRNGWLYTGDIAYMDEEGYFFIVDRKKDMIISGGYNIYPREIDEVLYEHPDIKEAVTVGISHPTRGEIVKAFVVPQDGVQLKKSDVISFCRQKLANYKVPKKVEFREELPKTMVGKVLRRALREEEEQKQTR
ncbi:long-chain-fatty-acid--CoA ligase [Desulfohalobium retbaense]|uniref:AMP-dependent synthetase and ligase n=1 Tax=Desulfohalobium retbaense (strain ATCC 49708 / DSM 5692 / JCM 16813 / HR100) TaxID=485915 RepID=C8X3P3_DESRD|nr:long-chain fatty acid--CoA ligase [Desulfohalobium retbaense]ACV69040.1 AMP-dependent synthetase and ligase [Desulfohalobium retbaense DSM 5692]